MINPQSRSNLSFSERKPVLTVVIIELLLLLTVFAAGAIATLKQLDYTSPVLISFTPIAIVLIIYLTLRRRQVARDWIPICEPFLPAMQSIIFHYSLYWVHLP